MEGYILSSISKVQLKLKEEREKVSI